jgi:intraflagellar transport protein 122
MLFAQYKINKIPFSAFHKAGKPEAALKVLQQLTDNAINEKRFDDAGYYNWVLSMQYLEMCKEQNVMGKFVSYQRDASIYYAYHAIQKYLVSHHDKSKGHN